MKKKKKPVAEKTMPHAPWNVGASYFIRTVTHHYTGKLVAVYPQELAITDAAWIADDGRFAQAVKDGAFNEIEPFPDGANVIIGRGSILDAVEVSFPIPRSQK
jgi:hypothetical protein